ERAAEAFADYWNAPGAWAGMNPDRRAAFLKNLPSNVHEWDCMTAETDSVLAFAPFAKRTLVVMAQDTVLPIRQICAIMKNCLYGLQMAQIPEGGHMAPLTRPDLVNPLVLSHLERFPVAPAAAEGLGVSHLGSGRAPGNL